MFLSKISDETKAEDTTLIEANQKTFYKSEINELFAF